ncbi:MAG: lipid-transfer protein [Chloroflexota bacterium]|nr:lipid-transfer protein [Chloroflexota bacterium]
MYRRVAIVGIGQSEFARKSSKTAWELALDACLAALQDAGIESTEIDGIVRYGAPNELVNQGLLVRSLGIPEIRWFCDAPYGGEATGAVVNQGAAAIVAKQASVVLLYRSLSQSTSGRMGRADNRYGNDEEVYATGEATPGGALAAPYGLLSPGQVFALWASRYKYENGISDEDFTRALGTLAVQQRQYGHNNQAAIMKDRPLTWDDYRGARFINWPLRLFDLCIENDGACAIVLVDADRARSLRPDPVYVLSATQSISPFSEPIATYKQDLTEFVVPRACERLYRDARLTPKDIDVAELYDATSFMALKSLETWGFVERGTAWKHLIEHGTGPHSPLPVNTHGGHLSEAYIHGMNAVTEAVKQLRGTAANQIKNAETAAACAPFGSAVLLGR